MLLLLVVVFGRAVARFYIDFLWHDGLGRSDVFWGVLQAKLTLFGIFFGAFVLLAGINLLIADRLAPSAFPANVHPYVERFHEVFGHRLRLLRYIGAGILALVVALPTTSQWQSWLLFRNSQSFGMSDAQFGADVGFYVFELPFLTFVLDWLFIAMVLVLVITLLAHVLNGGVVFASPMPSVRPATKGHIAVLLAVLAALKAADYWVSRYETTNERRGFVQGATYAVVEAQLPALMLLMLVALLVAVLYLATMRRTSWRIPVIASILWLVLIVGWPARLPVRRPVAGGQPEPAVTGGGVHHAQRHGHAQGDGRRGHRQARGHLRGVDGRRGRGRPEAVGERAPAQPGADAVALPDRSGRRGRACRSRTSTSTGTRSRASASRSSSPPASCPSTRARTRAGRAGT